jgi:CoA-transferase family III
MSSSEAQLWARSGGLELTGRADGPALPCAGAPASAVQRVLDALAALGVAGRPGIGLLGERASLLGYVRAAPFSAGGHFQIMPARDGWFGLSLARDSDVELVPALVEGSPTPTPWRAVAQWLRTVTIGQAEKRAVLLGLPAASVPSVPPARRRPGVVSTPGGRRNVVDHPVVVDLTSLWAGPLCAHVLGLAGARVIKVESRARPDGARATPEFFDKLHEGHEFVTLDFIRQVAELRDVISSADVVIEGSRPRALRGLGIDADAEVARGAVWVSITAYGRTGTDAMRVGFGDDVAAGAGLVAWEDGVPYPAGDALADPLAGVSAALAAVTALRAPTGALLDVSMHDVAVDAYYGYARMTS